MRVDSSQTHQFDFPIEPMPYTRLNHLSRFTASSDSQEQKYIKWTDDVRNLFDALDFKHMASGLPWYEPLEVSGMFYVSENFEGKDLDNLVKGIVDAMNLSRRKDWQDLATRLWIDDKQIYSHSGFKKVGIKGAEKSSVSLNVRSLWDRHDPNLNCLGAGIGAYPFNIEWLENDHGITLQYWVWPVSTKSVFTVFSCKELLFLYRQFFLIDGLSTATAKQLIQNTELFHINEGLFTGNPKYWVSKEISLGRATTALNKIREELEPYQPFNLTTIVDNLAKRYDHESFETQAEELAKQFRMSWGSIRFRMMMLNVNWQKYQKDEKFTRFVKKLEDEYAKRNSNANKSKR